MVTQIDSDARVGQCQPGERDVPVGGEHYDDAPRLGNNITSLNISAPVRPIPTGTQATSTKGERWRYCLESSMHSTRPSWRSIASATMGEPAIQSVVRGSSNHCRYSARYSGVR